VTNEQTRAATWNDASFSPVGGTCAEQPSLHAVRIVRKSGAVVVTLADESGDLSAPFTAADWSIGDADAGTAPIAVAGGWVNDTVLHLDVVFFETPHRLRLSCDSTTREFTAHWVTAPLRLDSTPLSDLKTPSPLG
jgi:hypothetical protein